MLCDRAGVSESMRPQTVTTVLLTYLLAPLHAQPPAAWEDPSPHTEQLVRVDMDVELEVLDWGGRGRPLVLLAGGGNTAHVFDEFAPKLIADHHVYGVTRRGFGASSYSPSQQGGDRLGRDVLAVMDALKLDRPVLVGHSIAGVEMSAVANLRPNGVAALVYLEAGYPYAFEGSSGPTMQEFQIQGLQTPNPGVSDLASFSALQSWDAKVFGFQMPEAEFRQTWASTPDGRPMRPRDSPGFAEFMPIMNSANKFRQIPVPALVIYASPQIPEAWMTNSSDPAVRNAADSYFTTINASKAKQAKAFEDGIPTARVVSLRSSHYVFLTSESAVLREIKNFLGELN